VIKVRLEIPDNPAALSPLTVSSITGTAVTCWLNNRDGEDTAAFS
jgi:hypothetical protein